MQTVLAVDDEISVRESYRLILSERYEVLLAENGARAVEILDSAHVDLVIVDMVMPGMSGMTLLQEVEKRDNSTPVLVVTADKSVSTAVEAMKLGARDYLIKPFDVDELLILTERAIAERKRDRELDALREAGTSGFESIIGESPALQSVLNVARRAMAVDSTVLVTGETGTGKDLLARAIHHGGRRADEPFVPISSCAIPEQLVESELFGHERGAFTGAVDKRVGKVQVADHGTLFLDEIGEMPLEAQAKLLRVLQEGQFYPVGTAKAIHVDVRFICATNRDLKECVANGTFREDLFYRLNVIPIEMPPLRRRREDLPVLAAHFVAKHSPRVNARAEAFTPEALSMLATHAWPGNVRELENFVERVLVHHSQETRLGVEHLDGLLPAGEESETSGLDEFEGLPIEEATNRLERHLIARALERSGQVQSRAAELLGTTRRILKYKMDQLSISAAPSEDGAA
jgi:two-component system, NtrC family, response regulator AtoC